MKQVQDVSKKIIKNVEQVIVGKRQSIVFSLVSWFSEGHFLLEDVPGVAKTILARALAASVGCEFKRIQCTPDLLPSDVTGASIFNQKTTEFEFRPGPLFSNIALADEINRTTPRTQAALLEAMAETLMKFSLGYPTMEEELKILQRLQMQHPIDSLQAVVTKKQIVECQKAVRSVTVDAKVQKYILQIVHLTRHHKHLALGGSPRASIALFRTAQSMAAIRGRSFATPDDVKMIAAPVLNHRMILKPESRLRKVTAEQVVSQVVSEIPVPVID